jgi:cell division protein FtsW (lipid II flippase)
MMAFRPARLRWTELGLLIAPAAMTVIGLLSIVLAPRGTVEWSWRDIWVGLAFGGLAIGVSVIFSIARFTGDQLILPLATTISAIGLLEMQRLGPSLAFQGLGTIPQRQLLYLFAGMGIMLVTALGLRRRLHLLRRYRYSLLAVSLALMAITVVIGQETYGAKLWISVGPIQIQPSELVKITLVIFLASYLDERREMLAQPWYVGRIPLPPIPTLIPLGVMWGACIVILIAANDLGASLLLFSIFLTMLYLATNQPSYVIVGLLSFAIASYILYQNFARIEIRVQNWLNPWADPLDAGYQQIQSDYAISSGGFFGVGFAQGQPWRIPAVHTDYVFSAIGEELGLLGTTAIVALLLLVAGRGLIIAMRAPDGFSRLLAGGLSTTLAIQTLIILGGVTRMIPLTGITLPFISYGGSSLLTNFVIAGMLLAVSSTAIPTSDRNRS